MTAAHPDKLHHVPRFRRVMREGSASYGGSLMARMESDESDTKRVTVRVPAKLLEQYEEALDDDTNRSEEPDCLPSQHSEEQGLSPCTHSDYCESVPP